MRRAVLRRSVIRAMIDITLPGDRIEEAATAAADAEVVRMAKPQVDAGVIAAGAPGEIPAAITPIVLPDGLLLRVDVRLVMERRPRESAR